LSHRSVVAFLKIRGSFEETLNEAIKLIGGIGYLESPIVLKPNICTGNDHTGCANVKVDIVKALINQIVNEKEDAEIQVVESDSMSKYADRAFQKYGYNDLIDELKGGGLNISISNLSKSPLKKITFKGDYFTDPELPEILTSAGSFVSVALPKTHELTMVTGALKNMFGLLPRKNQGFYHPNIHEVILDLNRMFRSTLCLIDGRTGLEGVTSGTPRELGCLILGKDPASVDATMTRAMGFAPEKIRHIVEAERFGLGSMDPEIVGDNVDSYSVKFKTPSGLDGKALITQ
jgi:uncharacterized protein (DUF362 family)